MKEGILLIHLPDTPLDGSRPVFTPPLGLWSMRSNNAAGKEVSVLDLGVSPLPRSFSFPAVGYSLLFPAHITHLHEVRKQISSTMEFLGGPTGSTLQVQGCSNVLGDGESWLAGRPLRFADLQPPRFSTPELEVYWDRQSPFSGFASGLRWMIVETSRGCPNACGFCKIPSLWGAWQSRPLEVLDEYFGYLVREHSVEEILFVDDNVAASVSRFLAIIELLRKHSLAWSVVNGIYNRALLNEDVQRALRGSRCLYMSLPFEAGNPRSAKLMALGKKYLDFSEAMHLSLLLKDMRIHTAGQFIIGYPGEGEQEVRDTLAYANALALDQRHIHIATPLPGTPMYEDCVANDYLVGEVAGSTYKTPIVDTPLLSRERLYALWLADREAAKKRKGEEHE